MSDSPVQGSATERHSLRLPPLFVRVSRARQIIGLIVIPIMFGLVAALMLKWAEPAWWTWQAIGILGAVVAGLEHLRRWSAAARGTVTGLVAATTVVGFHALLPGQDATSFEPTSFVAYAAIASAGLHALGVGLRKPARPL